MLQLRMAVPRLVSAEDIFYGHGISGVLRSLNAAKTLVIASNSLLKNESSIEKIKKHIGTHALEIMSKPSGEPTWKMVIDNLANIIDFAPDWIVAIGGGSVIDFSKILWVLYEHPHLTQADLTIPFSIPTLRNKAKLAILPTTAGTGSEVSSAAVFLDPQSGSKHMLVSHELLPDCVILDPDWMTHTPIRAKAAAGLDALAHATEGYVSRYPNPFLDCQAEQAIRIILRDLKPSLSNEATSESQTNMMIASQMAGWVQNMKIPGLGHAIAHQLGTFGIPHGIACGLLLSTVIRLNCQDEQTANRYLRLARYLGFNDIDSLIKEIDNLITDCDLAPKLSAHSDLTRDEIEHHMPQIIQGALKDPCAKANPRDIDAALIEQTLAICL